jgi:hypothetical protein
MFDDEKDATSHANKVVLGTKRKLWESAYFHGNCLDQTNFNRELSEVIYVDSLFVLAVLFTIFLPMLRRKYLEIHPTIEENTNSDDRRQSSFNTGTIVGSEQEAGAVVQFVDLEYNINNEQQQQQQTEM